jgi:hypothetical protein
MPNKYFFLHFLVILTFEDEDILPPNVFNDAFHRPEELNSQDSFHLMNLHCVCVFPSIDFFIYLLSFFLGPTSFDLTSLGVEGYTFM